MARSIPDSRWATAKSPVATAPAGGGARVLERLVLVLPILLLPHVGTPDDILRVGCLVAAVLAIDLGLDTGWPATPAALGIAIGAGLGLAVGPGAAWPLALFAAVAMLERTARADQDWLARIGLRALAAALLVDLALVVLDLERSLDWLALGAGISLALAAAERLRVEAAAAATRDAAADDRRLGALETALAVGLVVAIGAHAALLAGDPALAPLARAGGYLVLPFFALGLLRFGWLALARREGSDPLGGALLAGWALAASLLLEP
ncbi:MAG: hypothetical protein H6852_14935 [Geminicoccaceae bacterium]|jgi:hypothetical protein|nr:hypothetical protein [Geminicoccaceae bacterium]HRY25751.1 hypothetical protein [Geminicoccaceae bacterium]